MDSLQLRVEFKAVEPHEEPLPTGFVRIEHEASSAILLTPDEIDPGRRYPLFTVLHGAGRQDAALAKGYRHEPARRQALFLIPRSVEPTWDLIAGSERRDLDARVAALRHKGKRPLQRPVLESLVTDCEFHGKLPS